MKTDLDQLKDEVLEYLAAHNFTVFHSQMRGDGGDPLPKIYWDTAGYPDYRRYLESAREAEVKIITCYHEALRPEQMEEVLEQLESGDMEREQQRQYQHRLNDLRRYESFTGVIELSFDYQGRVYIYSIYAPWYEEFMEIAEIVEDSSLLGGDDESRGPMGGYFSQN